MASDVKTLAAIDVGTNSIHMVIVQIKTSIPSFSVIESEKATVRLGERCPQTGNLTEDAIHRAIEALRRCQEICRTQRVEEIVAVATSATRESPNGTDFIRRIYEELGLHVEVISGQEEARRIYLGVISAMELKDEPHILIDIGGGSTEMILGDGRDPLYLSSTKIGAVRLTDLFITSDPISPMEYDRLLGYIHGSIERPTDDLRILLKDNSEGKLLKAIGTSGTIETLALLHAKEKLGTIPTSMHGYEVPFADLENIVWRLRRANLEERTALVRQKRAEIILAGALVLLETMRLLGVPKIILCQRALREGLVVDWMIRHGYIEDGWRYQSTIRDRSILKLADKYGIDVKYAKQVAEHALSLFDQTRGIFHEWEDDERHLLWAAAMLHNSGHHISHDAHHKHSYYLIRNGELLGYTESEIEAIANLARYHRKSEPKKKHDNFQRLGNERLKLFVRQASTFLRLATALDRRQIGAIASIRVVCNPRTRTCGLSLLPRQHHDPCTLELWSLDYKKQPFESQFNVTLSVSLE
ncbi:Ppx/GppA family phosphatase [Pseudanabaena sp. FACHB-1998]|uniref:Ppx/GppA phosphatase family protein n=1 Tax=Pseudanabaena sp. FACHB-1998 TaxID=2692858 RepID=UPI0016805BFD|nr:Ppx/GppA phosphatase family protein [Pseudanabaena sp. FACHB-1998]MBD2177185.1 Ppx/GppA family phosphatase [Pseudanabaena sp. FACHB-1998]